MTLLDWIQITAYIALGIIVYTYFVFPLVTLLRAVLVRREWKKGENTASISVVIVCFNEQNGIQKKLENVIACDYPGDQLEIIVASDGSTDNTQKIVEDFPDPRVQLFAYERRGKIPALNDVVAHARGDILVFTDANSILQPDSLKKLSQHFVDESIGCVAGNQVYVDKAKKGNDSLGERSYWNIDRVLKQAQTKSGSAISATGALYAIRGTLFQQVPEGVTDDFFVSTNVIRQGYRLVYENDAIALEAVVKSSNVELGRKVRIMTRGIRGLLLSLDLFNPFKHGFYAIQILSHKLLKRICIIPILFLIIISPWLFFASPFFKGVSICIWAALAAILLSLMTAKTYLGRMKVCKLCIFFAMANLAALIAITNVVTGRKIDKWQPTGNT